MKLKEQAGLARLRADRHLPQPTDVVTFAGTLWFTKRSKSACRGEPPTAHPCPALQLTLSALLDSKLVRWFALAPLAAHPLDQSRQLFGCVNLWLPILTPCIMLRPNDCLLSGCAGWRSYPRGGRRAPRAKLSRLSLEIAQRPACVRKVAGI